MENSRVELKKMLERSTNIVKRTDVFDIAWLPPNIVLREPIKELFLQAGAFVKYRHPNNLLVVGAPGTGKTLSARVLMSEIHDLKKTDLECVYVNCRDKNAIDIIGDIYGEELRGVSGPEAISKFLETGKKDYLIILDEIDRAKGVNQLLYLLSRPKEVNMKCPINISLILVTNNIEWDRELDAATRSSLQLSTIIFERYEVKQLVSILKFRAKLAFDNNRAVDDPVLNYIANIVFREADSDTRAALRILLAAAQDAEKRGSDIVSKANVDKIYKEELERLEKLRIESLGLHRLLMALAIAETSSGTATDIYNHYRRIAIKMKMYPKQKSTFYYDTNYLASQGLVVREHRSTKKGRVLMIVPKIDKTVIQSIAAKRLSFTVDTEAENSASEELKPH